MCARSVAGVARISRVRSVAAAADTEKSGNAKSRSGARFQHIGSPLAEDDFHAFAPLLVDADDGDVDPG